MNFKESASRKIGKRVIVSIRLIAPGQADQYSGYWGTIVSVDEDGFLVEVEGGSEDPFEMIPPELDMLEKARHRTYEFADGTLVENIDYEVYLVGADDPSAL